MGEQVMEGPGGAERSGAGETPRRSHRRRFGRRIAQTLLAAALVALLIWGVMFLRVVVLMPRTVQQEASDGYGLMPEEFARPAAADAELLDEELGPVLGIERTVHCAVEPADRGWSTMDHRTQSTLREVEVRVVPEDVTDPEARAGALLAEAGPWQGEAGHLVVGKEKCAVVAESRLPADGAVPVNRSNFSVAAVVVAAPGDLEPCLTDPGPSARALGSARAEAPGGSAVTAPDGARLLTVVREARISSSSLDGLPLPDFCEPAVSTPQLPDALER